MPGIQIDNDFNIHIASEEEYTEAKALRAHVFREVLKLNLSEEHDMDTAYTCNIVMIHANRVVGNLRIYDGYESILLGRIVVDPIFGGRGLGKKLVDYAVDYIKNNGKYKCFNHVNLWSRFETKVFYEKCGFYNKGETKDFGEIRTLWMYRDL
ncbi:acyl-CoA N-acyltransferase [Kickxella alabastrina]|uniref:acyl-CoA N-acyltransferase n=1 Tax=Kickxella alabastrina TaxID=61397 RepID=UPI00221E6150|nr:acyl-CoA N-acyltransferase [Kickxella alabastrina]KAI7822284.1 acyl-CoA N-acyltransferase [Kickxella alabastrina]KAJ1946550.1 hypothetical protein GGF37_001100 [Kickxella alabastrina]